MPDFESSSSHSIRDPQPINPYQASRSVDPRETRSPSTANLRPRNYQARLTWSNRQALLKSVGPERLAAIIGGLLWLKSLLVMERAWRRHFQFSSISEGLNSAEFATAILTLAQGLLVMYLCWLQWRYADLVRQFAGGETADLHDWSRLHLRTSRLKAAEMVVAVIVQLISFIMLLADW